MPAREPAWWYAGNPGMAADLLDPLGRLWGWVAARRINSAARYRASLPVVCIGNFTAGGTGKTPLAIHVAQLLAERGERPVFLTRGYGGRVRKPRRVDLALDTAAEVGDEPLLLARHAPVMVAGDRAKGAALIEADAGLAPPTAIVMDDGLQNPGLAKDLVIAVVDGGRGLGNGRVIPAGPLRAPLEVQLALADAIVVNVPRSERSDDGRVAGFLRDQFDGPVLEATIQPIGDMTGLTGARVLALAGIANPGRFYDLLEVLGAEIVARSEFRDHHAFREADARAILAEADRLDARIATTEKDWLRLIGGTGALARLRERATAVPIRVHLEPRDAGRLASLVEAALIERRKDRIRFGDDPSRADRDSA